MQQSLLRVKKKTYALNPILSGAYPINHLAYSRKPVREKKTSIESYPIQYLSNEFLLYSRKPLRVKKDICIESYSIQCLTNKHLVYS